MVRKIITIGEFNSFDGEIFFLDDLIKCIGKLNTMPLNKYNPHIQFICKDCGICKEGVYAGYANIKVSIAIVYRGKDTGQSYVKIFSKCLFQAYYKCYRDNIIIFRDSCEVYLNSEISPIHIGFRQSISKASEAAIKIFQNMNMMN